MGAIPDDPTVPTMRLRWTTVGDIDATDRGIAYHPTPVQRLRRTVEKSRVAFIGSNQFADRLPMLRAYHAYIDRHPEPVGFAMRGYIWADDPNDDDDRDDGGIVIVGF